MTRKARNSFPSILLLLALGLAASPQATAAPTPTPTPGPTHADVSYGPHPHQLLDVFLPPRGTGPFPVVINYATLWQPGKRTPGLGWYTANQCALVVVEMRTMAFQKVAQADGATCYVKFPGHPSEKYDGLWDFMAKQLKIK